MHIYQFKYFFFLKKRTKPTLRVLPKEEYQRKRIEYNQHQRKCGSGFSINKQCRWKESVKEKAFSVPLMRKALKAASNLGPQPSQRERERERGATRYEIINKTKKMSSFPSEEDVSLYRDTILCSYVPLFPISNFASLTFNYLNKKIKIKINYQFLDPTPKTLLLLLFLCYSLPPLYHAN